MSNPKWEAERQYWIDAKEGTFIGWVFKNLPMHRDLCMWFVEIRGFQQANSAEDLTELMISYSKDIFEERDFDKVDRAKKKYQKCTQD